MVNIMNATNPFSSKQKDEEAAYERARRKAIVSKVMELFTSSVYVFTHINMGVRYFDLLGATGSAATLLTVAILAMIELEGKAQLGSVIMALYLFAYVIAAVFHIRRGQKLIGKIKTTYSGTPWLYALIASVFKDAPPIQEYQVKLYVEPITVFVASFFVGIVSPQLSLWLAFSAVCMFVRGQQAARQAREKYLDMIDEQIEAEEMTAIVRGLKQPAQARGVECWGAFTPQQQELIFKRTGEGQ